MIELILEFLEQIGVLITLSAVAVIVGGFAFAWGRYIVRFSGLMPEQNFKRFKIEFGRVLLLGLEILVLGDVIHTITAKPTFQSLAILAFLVVIRTVMSWALTLEVEGRWPWQSPVEDAERA